MEGKRRKEKLRLKDILILQAVVMIYTLSSVMAKLASGQESFSALFLLFYLVELLILGVYALLWQQMIKKFELSVAYTNRAMALLWSMLWAVVLFRDRVTVKNIIGVAFVIAGTVIVNSGDDDEEKTAGVSGRKTVQLVAKSAGRRSGDGRNGFSGK